MNASDLHAYAQMIAALDAEAWHRASLADFGPADQRHYWEYAMRTTLQERDEMWDDALNAGVSAQLLLGAVNAARYALHRQSGLQAPTPTADTAHGFLRASTTHTDAYPKFPGLPA